MISMKVIGTPLYQWENGRRMQIFPLLGMKVNAVHFSNLGDSEALVVEPKEENGMIVADIPNVLLQSGRNLVVYSVNVAQDCCETILESVFSIRPRPRPSDYVYTETEVLSYVSISKRMKALEDGLDEQVASSIEEYLKENPPSGGVQFETDHTLKLENGILSVNTTNRMEQDNTLPITSAGVFATVGNIEALLKTI